MGKTTSKTLSDERTKETHDVPKVVGLRYFGNFRGLTDVDPSNSYVVFLDRTDPKHIDKLIKFINTLNEKPS
jgi:hypothetical protein